MKELSDQEKHVMHDGGTERPFSGEYWDKDDVGQYACKSCGQILFSSDTKLDTSKGSPGLQGWPAFGDAIKGAITYREDTKLPFQKRTEAVCSQCGVHLGHVFDIKEDGFEKHYCVNSCALDFKSKDN